LNSGNWFALGAMIASVLTLLIAVVNEIRKRRAYHPVAWHIDWIKTVEGQDIDIFELTNTGTKMATDIHILSVGGTPGTSDEMRPITVLRPGEAKRFPLRMVYDVNESWLLIKWTPAHDHRYFIYEWHPLGDESVLFDTWINQQIYTRWGEVVSKLKVLLPRKTRTVGPEARFTTTVRGWKGTRTAEELKIATKDAVAGVYATFEKYEQDTQASK